LLLNQLQQTTQLSRFPFAVHFGPIASGDEDIVDPLRANVLRSETEAICVAWEGSGGARTAAFNGIGFAEIRCITDGADPGAAASFRENCTRALPNAAKLLVSWCQATQT
jgi:adenosylhomocysteine nucleosidase